MSEGTVRKSRRWWRWPRRVFVGLLAVVAAWAFWKAVEDRFDRPGLETSLAALDERDRPWRLEDLHDGGAAVPDATNSARAVKEAADLLPDGFPGAQLEGRLAHGRGRLEPIQTERLLEVELNRRQKAVEKARALRHLSAGRIEMPFEGEYAEPQTRQHERAVLLLNLLRFDAIRRAHDNDLPGALESCQAMVAVGRSFGDEPVMISQETRVHAAAGAAYTLEGVLNLGATEEESLRAMQKLLAEEEGRLAKAQVLAWRGERALVQRRYEDFVAGRLSLEEIRKNTIKAGRQPLEPYLGWLWWRSLSAERREMLELLAEAIEIAGLPPHEQIERESKLINRLHDSAWRRRFGWGPFAPFTGVRGPFPLAHVRLRVIQVLLAAERYRLRQGEWPADLGRLVPAYLEIVPLDPFDGQPLRCRHEDGDLFVYSVGYDGRDDGGTTDLVSGLVAPGRRRRER